MALPNRLYATASAICFTTRRMKITPLVLSVQHYTEIRVFDAIADNAALQRLNLLQRFAQQLDHFFNCAVPVTRFIARLGR